MSLSPPTMLLAARRTFLIEAVSRMIYTFGWRPGLEPALAGECHLQVTSTHMHLQIDSVRGLFAGFILS